jgi:hypothetical protein
MKLGVLAAMAIVVSPAAFGQTKTPNGRAATADRDQLGTCAQILAMSSTDWIAQFNEKARDSGSSQEKTLRAIGIYGKCYDSRTDRLAASIARKGTRQLMGVRGNFRDFEPALQNFTDKALAANDPPADAVKAAYAALYEKQFRYAVYAAVETPAPKSADKKLPTAPTPHAAASTPPSNAPASSPARSATGTGVDDADPLTMVKNHFGELLDALPDDQMHQLHSAFGDVVGRGAMSEATRLAIYRYAIFLLEPLSAQPFSPPPF